ncbi:MAG: GNAT family N-acetyltransferase [Candidatus Hodarchaeales archaeon]|jgi:GNAT superfamily N-acetyltransferase
MDIDLTSFDPLDASKEEWERYHVFRKKRHMELRPDDPYLDNNTAEKSFSVQFQNPELDFNAFGVFEKGNHDVLIGTLYYGGFTEKSPSFGGNKHLIIFNLGILADWRKKGIERLLMNEVNQYAKANGKTTLMSETDEADIREFFKEIGAQEAISGAENRLKLESVEWSKIQSWMDEGPKHAAGVSMQFFYSLPDELLEEYCKIYTETLNQQPLGDLDINDIIYTPESYRRREEDFKKMGMISLTAVTIEDTGAISGLTEMVNRPERKTMITQGLTGVKEEYRGRGLGKWLKAAMLLRSKKEFSDIEIVTTDNASINAPMLSINERMGFKLHKENVNVQISQDKLEEYLTQ